VNPGEVITSGSLLVSLPLAMLAGLVSFASPCVLPLVPGYLGYVGGFQGDGARDRRRLVIGASLFVLGFATVFVLYGAAFGVAGAWLVQWESTITRVLGVVVILMGLVFIGRFGAFQRTKKLSWLPATGLGGAPLLGAVFAIGWTPCIGPTLSAVLALGLNGGSPLQGALLAFGYCLGLGVPFILIALGLGWATRSVAFLRTHIRAVNIAGGVLLIVVGVLMVSGVWTLIMYQLQGVMYGFDLPI
jgi:cytochrome c-type biogenesis protein